MQLIIIFILLGLFNCSGYTILIKDSEKFYVSDDLKNYRKEGECEEIKKKYVISHDKCLSQGLKTGYYDYFNHTISIYNFGLFGSKDIEIDLDEYCPSISKRYITLERYAIHNLIGFFLFRLYNRTDYIVRCHY